MSAKVTNLAWTKTEFIIRLISNIINANYRVVSIHKVQAATKY